MVPTSTPQVWRPSGADAAPSVAHPFAGLSERRSLWQHSGETGGPMHVLPYEYMNFHRMALYGGLAVLILILVARFLMGRL
jgi:hypothetical protein